MCAPVELCRHLDAFFRLKLLHFGIRNETASLACSAVPEVLTTLQNPKGNDANQRYGRVVAGTGLPADDFL